MLSSIIMTKPQLLADYEQGLLDFDDTIALFQDLIDSGLAWRLQGSYGRTAQALLDEGYLTQP